MARSVGGGGPGQGEAGAGSCGKEVARPQGEGLGMMGCRQGSLKLEMASMKVTGEPRWGG